MDDPANYGKHAICQDCQENYAVSAFVHLDGRWFYLCHICYYAADHEDDYGKDFQPLRFEEDEEDEEEEQEEEDKEEQEEEVDSVNMNAAYFQLTMSSTT